jgi:hypothetical protein
MSLVFLARRYGKDRAFGARQRSVAIVYCRVGTGL